MSVGGGVGEPRVTLICFFFFLTSAAGDASLQDLLHPHRHVRHVLGNGLNALHQAHRLDPVSCTWRTRGHRDKAGENAVPAGRERSVFLMFKCAQRVSFMASSPLLLFAEAHLEKRKAS